VEHYVPFEPLYVNKMNLKKSLSFSFSQFCNKYSINSKIFVTIAQNRHKLII
jgi:hypothetical protein